MRRILTLLLPALIPSWRFFRAVEPSPRVERRVFREGTPGPWQEAYIRPARLPFATMLRRMVWNPEWNAALFLVSLAERVVEQGSDYAMAELLRRVSVGVEGEAVQLRLTFVSREGERLVQEVLYESAVTPLAGLR